MRELARHLGERLRLAQGRIDAERLAAIHDEHRRGGDSFHPRPFPRAMCVNRI